MGRRLKALRGGEEVEGLKGVGRRCGLRGGEEVWLKEVNIFTPLHFRCAAKTYHKRSN